MTLLHSRIFSNASHYSCIFLGHSLLCHLTHLLYCGQVTYKTMNKEFTLKQEKLSGFLPFCSWSPINISDHWNKQHSQRSFQNRDNLKIKTHLHNLEWIMTTSTLWKLMTYDNILSQDIGTYEIKSLPLCRQRRTEIMMTSEQLNREVIPAKVISSKPYCFMPESEIWPQYRPEGIWAETCALLWNLMLSSSYRCLLSLLAGCITWKPGGNNHGSQIKPQGMAQVRVTGPTAIRCQCCNISVGHGRFM